MYFYVDFKMAFSKNRHKARVSLTSKLQKLLNGEMTAYEYSSRLAIPVRLRCFRSPAEFVNPRFSPEYALEVVAISIVNTVYMRVYCRTIHNPVSEIVERLDELGMPLYIDLSTSWAQNDAYVHCFVVKASTPYTNYEATHKCIKCTEEVALQDEPQKVWLLGHEVVKCNNSIT